MRHLLKAAVLIVFCAMASTCFAQSKTKVTTISGIKLPDGSTTDLFTLKSDKLEVQVISYGGFVVSLKAPDRKGTMADVVLGFDDPAAYYANNHSKSSTFFGPIVGRYANRIAGARFTLDGKEYLLAKNNGENSLHSGPTGFHQVLWKGRPIEGGVELSYIAKDGEGGFPGNLSVKVRYTVSGGELKIEYLAKTDQDTVLNLTNHSYFNLSGDGSKDILSDLLTLHASKFTPVDAGLIPTGELRDVAGTPLDFRKATAIGARIQSDYEQMKIGKGYDHNFVIDGGGKSLTEAAEVFDPTSGRVLTVSTTEPGVQLYTSNFLDGTVLGKKGVAYAKNSGVCLETQHYPDSPNQPTFPTTELKPGEQFHSVTVFRFSTR